MATKRKSNYSSYKSYKKKYSTSNGRAKGQFKAARRSSDSLSFVVNSNVVFSARYGKVGNRDGVGVACVNMWDVLARNKNFKLMQNMYDQVKMDGIKYKLNITNAETDMASINSIKNYSIFTAWDKTGLSPGQYKVGTFTGTNANPSGVVEPIVVNQEDWDNNNLESSCWWCTIGSSIVNQTGVQKSILNSFQRWNSYGSLYPSLAQEKQQYLQTGDIAIFDEKLNENRVLYPINKRYKNTCFNSILNSNNPVIPFESNTIRFKPCLLVGVFSNQIEGEATNITQFGDVLRPVIFNAEIQIAVTFRNLKGTT